MNHEALQKVSDPPLKKCPACGKSQLRKLMSAPIFRLKGSGWYETDFKTDQDKKRNLVGDEPAKPADAKPDEGAKADAPKAEAAKTEPAKAEATKTDAAKAPVKDSAKKEARAAPASRAVARNRQTSRRKARR